MEDSLFCCFLRRKYNPHIWCLAWPKNSGRKCGTPRSGTLGVGQKKVGMSEDVSMTKWSLPPKNEATKRKDLERSWCHVKPFEVITDCHAWRLYQRRRNPNEVISPPNQPHCPAPSFVQASLRFGRSFVWCKGWIHSTTKVPSGLPVSAY